MKKVDAIRKPPGSYGHSAVDFGVTFSQVGHNAFTLTIIYTRFLQIESIPVPFIPEFRV